jgi:hypothetical protein
MAALHAQSNEQIAPQRVKEVVADYSLPELMTTIPAAAQLSR